MNKRKKEKSDFLSIILFSYVSLHFFYLTDTSGRESKKAPAIN